jgi:Resolvase, N terminal domain
MSTEHQRYSTENEPDAIRSAARRNFKIVRTYEDQGKSGLNIDGRAGLRSLLADVVGGRPTSALSSSTTSVAGAGFSAYYEYQCKRAGVRVEYCAEPFENDGSIGSDIQKMLKRKMVQASRIVTISGVKRRRTAYSLRRRNIVSSLRSFFRLARHRDYVHTVLAAAIPSLPDGRWHPSRRRCQPTVFGFCRTRARSGERRSGCAIVSSCWLLARLGLRAGEVVRLELGDIDWCERCLSVHGKGRVERPLPGARRRGTLRRRLSTRLLWF